MTGPSNSPGTRPLRTVLLASAAAVLPLAALSLAPTQAAANAVTAFTPSTEPMVLTRTLRRPLPGGITIATARSYRVRFIPEGSGFRIEGDLIDVDIEAPRQFEALMAMERTRPDTGMFPMRIDAQGRFVSSGQRDQKAFATQAGRQAQTMVPAGLPAGEQRDANAFIAQATTNPIQTAWPEDLFRPAPGKRTDTNVMPLPGGKTGQVSIEIEAQVDQRSGLLSRLQRNVTTRLGGATRVTEETWTLKPAG